MIDVFPGKSYTGCLRNFIVGYCIQEGNVLEGEGVAFTGLYRGSLVSC